jgi:NitT/TauT family transport system substrate-binding protein
MSLRKRLLALGALVAIVAGACGTGTPSTTLTKVKLQLQWVTQAQFAGYYAALDQNYTRMPASMSRS